MTQAWTAQEGFRARCEWGAQGLAALLPYCDVIVIVDVLSFSSCVDVAVSRGAVIYPWPWNDDTASRFAEQVQAQLAHKRRDGGAGFSLSPASLQFVTQGLRLVLPSPNGSTLSRMTGDVPTLAGCLRNARVVAERAQTLGKTIGVIAAGERWPDGTLRPALEDWLGAGAIVAHLGGARSPEAAWAHDAFLAVQARIHTTLRECSSGRELREQGFDDDVALAAELNASVTAPLLTDGAYRS